MNLQQLKIIIALSDGKTLQEIAADLRLTQPTVSFHLRKLEEELGIPLVQKNSRSLRLTEAALEILPYAKRATALLDEARMRINERRGLSRRSLRIGASFTPATFFMPPYLQLFQQQHPELQMFMIVNRANRVLELLRQYEIDVALVSLAAAGSGELIQHRLAEDELVLVFSPSHPLAEREQIRVDDLESQTFLLHEPGSTSRELTDEWAAQTGLQFASRMELGAIETIKEAIKHGIGVGVLPRRSVLRETASGELCARPLPGYRNRRFICLVYRAEDPLAPQAQAFVRFALDHMRQAGLAQ